MTTRRTTGRRGVTVHDVARRAGVSPMTVSRVVNGAAGVSAETRALVQAEVTRLGFVPSRAARGLRARRSLWMALVFQGSSEELRSEPGYVIELQEGVIRRCLESGYHAAVEVLSADNTRAREQLRGLTQGLAPDGVLLAPPLSSSPAMQKELRAARMPFVRIAPSTQAGAEPAVRMDDQAAARQMTEFLLSLGHRQIGFVMGHPAHVASSERLAGFEAALRAWGLKPQPQLIAPGDFTFDGGRRAAAMLLDARGVKPTAIFASNDELAAGCLTEAFRRGLAVPRDLSVTGFDDTHVASMLYPPLTTVRQSIREMGHVAAGQLLALIDGLAPPQSVQIAHRLVERQSAAAPRA
jgi:LacI family transcriptional regulator